MPTLFVSTTSPYARLLMMIAYQQGIDLQLKFVLPWENPNELITANPFSQVPALQWENGTVITETPLIIADLAPHLLTGEQLPFLSKALTILFAGVRAYSLERFETNPTPHPFIARSTELLQNALPNLPALNGNSQQFGEQALLLALEWIGFRLPTVFATLSEHNKQAVAQFATSDIMQKTAPTALERQPKTISDL